MGMLNFFDNIANKMRAQQTAVDSRLDEADARNGMDTLGFIESHFEPPVSAPSLDAANMMSQTNAAAGISNPAASMLDSRTAETQAMPALTMSDPRSNNFGALYESYEDKQRREEQERLQQSYVDAAKPRILIEPNNPSAGNMTDPGDL